MSAIGFVSTMPFNSKTLWNTLRKRKAAPDIWKPCYYQLGLVAATNWLAAQSEALTARS